MSEPSRNRRRSKRIRPGHADKAEVRSTKPVRTFSWITAAVFVLGLSVMAGVQREKNTLVKEVTFTGAWFTEEEEMRAVIPSPVGMHPDSLRYIDMMDTLASLPYVKQARIHVDAGGRMVADIRERSPLAMLVDGKNRIYVDEEGHKMPVRLGKAPDVPLVHGFSAAPEPGFLSDPEFETVRNFLLNIKNDDFAWMTLSEIGYDPRDGVLALSHENGVKLLFGFDRFEEKIRDWQVFYSEVIRNEGIDRFSLIDFRFRNQIVTR